MRLRDPNLKKRLFRISGWTVHLYEEKNNWPQDLPWMATKEELRSSHVHFNLGAEKPCDPFEWGSLKFSSHDFAAVIRLEGGYFDLLKRCQRKVYPE
jgi:hypothetical protein